MAPSGLTASAIAAAALLSCGLAQVAFATAAKPEAPVSGKPAARFVMLDSRLNTEPIALLRLDLGAPGSASGKAGEIAYLDSGGARKTKSLSEIIALAPTTWVLATPAAAGGAAAVGNSAGDEAPSVWIDLIDGQRLTGTFSAPAEGATDTTKPGASADPKAPKSGADSDTVAWQHPRLGTVNIPLDVTARYIGDAPRLESTLRTPLSRVNDTIVLANGDRVEGFIEHLGVSMRIGPAGAGGTKTASGGAAVQASEASSVQSIIPSDQVVLAHLVNEPRTLSGAAVWLTDGSVLALSSARTDADRGRITLTTRGLSGASASLDLTDLRAAVVDAARITPLSALPIAAQIGSSDRPSFEPAVVDANAHGGAGAPLGAADILLPGPMVVEWTLPGPGEGATMLGGVAQLDESCWAWGNCVVVFSIVPASDAPLSAGNAESAGGGTGRELARGTLNAETPTLNVKADLSTGRPGDRLRVRIDAGARGPIQDRVTLRRFIFVSSRPGA